MSAQRKQRAADELAKAIEQGEATIRRMGKLSEDFTGHGSEALCGTLGGVIGGAAGIILSPLLAFPSLLMIVPLAGIGLLSGILAYRGRRRFKLERLISENRIAETEIIRRIEALPRNAPKEVRDHLWLQYMNLTGSGDRAAAYLLDSPERKTEKRQLIDSTGGARSTSLANEGAQNPSSLE